LPSQNMTVIKPIAQPSRYSTMRAKENIFYSKKTIGSAVKNGGGK